jgi:hypothetical protein
MIMMIVCKQLVGHFKMILLMYMVIGMVFLLVMNVNLSLIMVAKPNLLMDLYMKAFTMISLIKP